MVLNRGSKDKTRIWDWKAKNSKETGIQNINYQQIISSFLPCSKLAAHSSQLSSIFTQKTLALPPAQNTPAPYPLHILPQGHYIQTGNASAKRATPSRL
jgi:hypothetical protein